MPQLSLNLPWSKARMECPRDKLQMDFQGYWKHPRHKCGTCEGLFLAEADVMEAAGHGPARFEMMGIRIAALPEGKIACPRDGATMRVLRYKGVEMDICAKCRSIWLERGEFEKVRLASRPAGKSNIHDGADAFDLIEFVGEAVGSLLDGF